MPKANMENSCPKLTGRVIFPEDESYNEDRLVSNYATSKNKFPKAIVYCRSAQDVQHAIQWARCRNISIRIRSGGHCHEAFSTGNGVLLIDVSEMKKVKVDPAKQIAIIEPGINNKELYTQLFKEGFTHVGGTCSEVGLSGLVLTGGIGPLIRRVGLTCDTLLYIEMVNAEGELIRATKENEHKDLFWASCGGGGGNFGVVTAMALKIYPVTDVTWFNLGWDWTQPVEEVIGAWQNFFGKQDKRWFSHLDLWPKTFPTEKFKKQPVKALGFFWGRPEDAKRELAPLLSLNPKEVTLKRLNWLEAIEMIEESTAVFITSKPEYSSTGAYANQNLPPEAIKIIGKTLRETTAPLFNLLFFTMGGDSTKVAPKATAYFYRDAKFFLNYTIQWLESKDEKAQISELQNLRKYLLPYTVGDYIGNPDPNLEDYLQSYYGDNVDKLRCVKKKYDPENIFKFEQSIPPAPTDWDCRPHRL